MTVKQRKRLVEKKLKETVNREAHEKCGQKTKLQEIRDDAEYTNMPYEESSVFYIVHETFHMLSNILCMHVSGCSLVMESHEI